MSLTIYRSSAGSGKTYTLAREYLSLALQSPDYYQKILAVTFTNRAAEEMKERVLTFLVEISRGEHDLIPSYAEELDSTEEEIIRAAADALTHLLHHYRYFNITTIDTFFHRVIRSFSREVGLQGSFRIEMDAEKVAEYISSSVYEGVEDDRQLKDWLVDFSLSGLQDGKGYETRRQVSELARQLFEEGFKSLPQEQFADAAMKEKIATLKGEIQARTRKFEDYLGALAQRFLREVETAGLSIDDFSYKASGPAGFFLKLGKKEFVDQPGARLTAALEDASNWSNKKSLLRSKIIELADQQFNPLAQDAIDFLDKNKLQYFTDRAVLKHLYTLGLITDLSQRLQEYKREEDMIMISDLPDFLSQIIDDTGSPFIYDKVGSWYEHFLIDEFQDTSQFQWRNFKPLLEESVSTGSKSIIVGDAKQSIYGWRGGDPTLLLETVEKDLPAVVDPRKNTNYRSTRNIVEFNNRLFGRMPAIMVDDMGDLISSREASLIKKTYENVSQKVADSKKHTSGLVEVSFFKAEEGSWKESAITKMVGAIEGLLAKGHQMREIAVLVRGNKDAADIVNFVLEYRRTHETNLEVISAEGMLLTNSGVVQMILSAFRHLIDPHDASMEADLVYRYLKLIKKKSFNSHADFAKLGSDELPELFVEGLQGFLHLPILELVEVLIRILGLNKVSEEFVYLQAFQDAVLEFTKNQRSDLRLFLDWWEDVGKKRSVQMTGALDAIEVITAHKSKGLQYPIVFIPFCNFSMDAASKPIWLESPYGKGQSLPVDYQRALNETHFSGSYQQEVAKWHLESLNILYVAFTRAENGLFIYCETPSNRDRPYSNASKLLYRFFQSEKISGWDSELKVFRIGQLPFSHREKVDSSVKLDEYPSNDWGHKLKIRKTGSAYFNKELEKSRNEGILLHQILAEVILWEDTDKVLERYEKAMLITATDRDHYLRLLGNLWKNPKIKSWFDGTGEVKTEVVVLPKDGEVKRLDRVVIKDQKAKVIDFKSGRPKYQDKIQIKEYLELMNEMGYQGNGYLLYLYTAEIIEVN